MGLVMNTALIVVHVLTCLVAVNYLPVFGQDQTCCTDCCDNTCDAPAPYNVTLDDLASMGPLYINFFPGNPVFAGTDNICLTFVSLPDGTYLLSFSTVYCNGFNTTESLIISQSDLGVFEAGLPSFGFLVVLEGLKNQTLTKVIFSGTCGVEATFFDFVNTTDCSLYLVYFCFTYGDCALAPGDDIAVFGISSDSTPISDDCLAIAMSYIASDGVPPQDYFIAPSQLDDACVTNLNCTNA